MNNARNPEKEELYKALAANNELYRTGAITRKQWVATNQELSAKGEKFGMTLPAFATTQVEEDN